MNPIVTRLRELAWPNAGWIAVAAAVSLSAIGIVGISTAEAFTVPPVHLAAKQLLWLFIALAVALACTLPRPRSIIDLAYPLLGLALLLEVLVILPIMPASLVPVRNGARSWFNFGGVSFEPSELTKIAFVLSLACYMRYRKNYRSLLGLLVPFGIMFLPMGLILKQPDLGTSLLFIPTLFAVLVAAGARKRHLGALAALALLAMVINVVVIVKLPDKFQILRPHQRARIRAIISQARGDTRYIRDIGYQQHVAMVLVGAGEFAGYPADRSPTLVHFNRLPEDQNDMIFAVIANRWGLMGGLIVMGLYLLLILSFLSVAMRTKDPFARLAIIGFAAMIFSQATINIGMTIGLFPITGITLPFVSYGGSSLVMTYAIVGLVLNFASRRQAIVARPSFEFDNADALFQ